MDRNPDTPRARGDKDAPHYSPVSPAEDLRTIEINQIAWGAVFAGVAVGLITQLLLNMFGVGIGLATLDPGTADNPSASGLGIGAGIWWVLSGIIASFLGGWVAGRLAGKPRESTGGWHGLTAWAVTSLIVIYLLTSAISGLVGGTMRALGSATSTAASAAANNPNAATNAVQSGVASATQNTNVEQLGNQLQEAAPRAANTAADAASTAALVSAIALMLGALAAWVGGRKGAVNPTMTRRALRGDADGQRIS